MTNLPTPLPSSLFQNLLPKLSHVLELTQHPEGTVTPQAKQALLQATNEFKHTLNQAKDCANMLAGGELLIQEQDEVIEMLERLREHKRQQLTQFAAHSLTPEPSMKMEVEVDSTASTPMNS
ncbi:hypothetical protein BJ138DRAFT_1136935 [Hygrophoropsis aurantiaca]|uniref:Uncharacterized protein n=1 Tax=Hygrophoropsis aurantiaca TaxID=72124 RepID=A0ACB8A5L3_9AGAM|nr:hypothetical protein BJ138DRAFT_1136935 [Hygrophoropsis aurantiaca]